MHSRKDIEILNPWDLSTRAEVRAGLSRFGRVRDQLRAALIVAGAALALVVVVVFAVVLPAVRDDEREFDRQSVQDQREFERQTQRDERDFERQARRRLAR